MTSSQAVLEAGGPLSVAGPTVNNAPSVLTLLSASQFEKYTHIQKVISTMNSAFEATFGDLFQGIDRVQSLQSLLNELGPNYIAYVLTSANDAENLEVYASILGRPAIPPNAPQDFKEVPGKEYWEVKLLCVHPSIQGQGIASMLITALEAEVKRQHEAQQQSLTATSSGDHEGAREDIPNETEVNKELRMILSTVEAANGPFYAKRGYVTTKSYVVPKHAFNNADDFVQISMEKVLITHK